MKTKEDALRERNRRKKATPEQEHKGFFRCARCGNFIDPKTAVGLELGINSGLYYKPEDFPEEEESQGIFEMGSDCAKIELAETKRKTQNT